MVGVIHRYPPNRFTFVRSNTISSIETSHGLHLEERPHKQATRKTVDTLSNSENSMQISMSFVLIIAQCFALFPVQRITSRQADDVRFTWRDFRIVYAGFSISAMTYNVMLVIYWFTRVGFSFKTAAALVFYLNGLLSTLLFFRIAMKWPEVARLWQELELRQLHYGYPRNLRFRIKMWTIFLLLVALVEHLLSHLYQLNIASRCSNGFWDHIRRYVILYHNQVFEVVRFSPYLGALSSISVLSAAFSWSFPDIFVIMISIALTSRFRLLNNQLTLVRGQVKKEEFWKEVRENYGELAFLTKTLDSCISGVVLLSFATDLFYLCQQLLYSMNSTYTTIQEIYVYTSFIYLAARTTVKSICAARVYEESKIPKYILYSVPSESYNAEVYRFLDQVTTDDVSLTGLNFFPVTRMALLTLAGTIVTYEIVLMQFGTASGASPSTNLTQLCLNNSRDNRF